MKTSNYLKTFKIGFILCMLLSTLNTLSQIANRNSDSFKIKASVSHRSYTEYEIIKSSKLYKVYFAEFKNERTIYISSANVLLCVSSLLRKNESIGYVATFCFSVSDLENKAALGFLTAKFIQSLAVRSKNNQLSKYLFFSDPKFENNWIAYKLKKPLVMEGGIIINSGGIGRFKDFMCRNDWICPVTACEACKRALCDLADCYDENGGGSSACRDESEWERIVCTGQGRRAVFKLNLKTLTK